MQIIKTAKSQSGFILSETLYQTKLKNKSIDAIEMEEKNNDEGNELSEDISKWPKHLENEAYQGLAGDIVKKIEPHTEADPVALLLQFLTAFGNIVGRVPYFEAEADKHFTNLFVCLIGNTSKGRKGTSWGHIERLFKSVDKDWSENRIQSGLSSGEGLIWAIRDPIKKNEPIRKKKIITDYQTVITDEGIEDKRLLLIESEFASTLRVLGREGNTLSAIIRNAWDKGNLCSLTKNSTAKATNAHISIIAHTTKDELVRYLDSTEAGNGFANRFIFICTKRSKILPEGGQIQKEDFSKLYSRLNKAVMFSKSTKIIKRDNEARNIWFRVYESLSEGNPGLLGSVTARAEAQVMRMACLYALLDTSPLIKKEHLTAALAVWEYTESSARFVFGHSLGDPVADDIRRILTNAPSGKTRTEISKLFAGHKGKNKINRALEVLFKHKLIFKTTEKTDGRPTEMWFSNKYAGGISEKS